MKKGFTLLEIVVYVAILAVIVVLTVSSFISVYQAFFRIRIERKLTLNGDAVLERMVREIRDASGIDGATSVFGIDPGVLKVGVKKFSLSGATLVFEDGVNPASDLTSDVSVSNLVFYRQSAGDPAGSDIVKIELTLEAGSGTYTKSKNFYASAVLRQAY